LTVTHTPAGDAVDLCADDLPPAQGIALCAAHLGRSRLMQTWIDPAVIDEADPHSSDPALDMFDPKNGPAYSLDFLSRYRAAQRQRQLRIEDWARAKLRQLRSQQDGPRDMAFIVHRTLADPRCLDPSIDPNDRTPGMSVWGAPRSQNYAANSMGRYTSLTGFLSQWSLSSQGDGPINLAKTSVPVALAEHTADPSVFPSDNETWAAAADGRISRHKLTGGDHYLRNQPKLVTELAEFFHDFASKL